MDKFRAQKILQGRKPVSFFMEWKSQKNETEIDLLDLDFKNLELDEIDLSNTILSNSDFTEGMTVSVKYSDLAVECAVGMGWVK